MITRNEQAAIAKVIADAQEALPGAEVIIVDGSSDETPQIAAASGAIVIPEPKGGPAPALLCALQASRRPIVVTVDADDTYPPEAFPALVEIIRSGGDVAGTDRLGSRPPTTMPLANWLANKGFNVLASVRVGRRLRDVHSGQRAYRRSVIEAFDWDVSGFAFPVDLLLWPAYAGYTISEIPITYRERIGETSLVRWESGKQTVRRLLRSGRRISRRPFVT